MSISSLLWLHWATCGEPKPFWRLIRHFGDAETARVNRRDTTVDLPEHIASRTHGRKAGEAERYVDAALRWLDRSGHHFVVTTSHDYPGRLEEISDPPPALFAVGDVTLLSSTQLAIVGTRRATASGRRVAIQLARDAANAGLTITSGMAVGIDSAAHMGALDAGKATIAVLGTGCDVVYPPRNRRLAREISEHGLLISEFPLGTAAFPSNFPRRNRVVTGLSVGTLVVEAALRSGSLISARLAMEQGREVFAVPGSILNAQSRGCHSLIREGARLTESIGDIAEELSLIVDVTGDVPETNLSPAKARIVETLGGDGTDIDELVRATGEDVASLMASLVELEIDGVIVRSASGYILAERHP